MGRCRQHQEDQRTYQPPTGPSAPPHTSVRIYAIEWLLSEPVQSRGAGPCPAKGLALIAEGRFPCQHAKRYDPPVPFFFHDNQHRSSLHQNDRTIPGIRGIHQCDSWGYKSNGLDYEVWAGHFGPGSGIGAGWSIIQCSNDVFNGGAVGRFIGPGACREQQEKT
jgi:hypothetical protein